MLLKEANGIVELRVNGENYLTNLEELREKEVDLTSYEYVAYERPIGRLVLKGGVIPNLHIHLATVEAFDETINVHSSEVKELVSKLQAVIDAPLKYSIREYPFTNMDLLTAKEKAKRIARTCGRWALNCKYSADKQMDFNLGVGSAEELSEYQSDLEAVSEQLAIHDSNIDGMETVDDLTSYYYTVQEENPWKNIIPEAGGVPQG